MSLIAAQAARMFGLMGEAARLRRGRVAGGTIPLGDLRTGIGAVDGILSAGSIVVIQGSAASGKSSLALHLAGSVLAAGGCAAWLDLEGQLHPSRLSAAGLGADEAFAVICPAGAGEAWEACRLLAEAGVDLVVLDPVAGLLPLWRGCGADADDLDGFRAWLAGELGPLAAVLRASGTRLLLVEHLASFRGEDDLAPRWFTAGGSAALGHAQAVVRLESRPAPGPGLAVAARVVRRGATGDPERGGFRVRDGRVLAGETALTGSTPP